MNEKDLAALMDRLEALEDKVAFLLNHQTVAYVPVLKDEKAANEAAVLELLRKGDMKEALKLYRLKHVMPFSDVQKAIDDLKKEHGIE